MGYGITPEWPSTDYDPDLPSSSDPDGWAELVANARDAPGAADYDGWVERTLAGLRGDERTRVERMLHPR